MRPSLWQPPVALSAVETSIVQRVHRAKLFVFLREQRHMLFSVEFQEELVALLYADRPKGHPPIPPAQLALATLLQAYTGVSDDEVIEATTMDRRWQLVLDCLDSTDPPFSKATLVAFRQRLIAHDTDRRLIERTLQVATASGAFSPKALRAALDSSPRWGAGRVEDTDNLLGHALRKVVSVLARQQGRGLRAVATELGAAVVGGPQSLKAAVDLDWDDPEARTQALLQVLAALDAVEQALDTQPEAAADPVVRTSLAAADQVRAQDVEQAPPTDAPPSTAQGMPRLRRGVSRDRRISIEDAQMRHGRKSRSVRVDGYKRHVLHDLDSGLVGGGGSHASQCARGQRHRRTGPRPRRPAGDPRRPGGTASRPRLFEQPLGTRTPRGAGHLVQSLARAQRHPLPHDGFRARLDTSAAALPRAGGTPLYAGGHRPLPGRHLCRLPTARALYCQSAWAQCQPPS
jgi:Transposase domain (DUF772)